MESISQPPSFHSENIALMGDYVSFKATSLNYHCSSKPLIKQVSANVNDIEDVMKQYIQMGGVLGYDMEGNMETVK